MGAKLNGGTVWASHIIVPVEPQNIFSSVNFYLNSNTPAGDKGTVGNLVLPNNTVLYNPTLGITKASEALATLTQKLVTTKATIDKDEILKDIADYNLKECYFIFNSTKSTIGDSSYYQLITSSNSNGTQYTLNNILYQQNVIIVKISADDNLQITDANGNDIVGQPIGQPGIIKWFVKKSQLFSVDDNHDNSLPIEQTYINHGGTA